MPWHIQTMPNIFKHHPPILSVSVSPGPFPGAPRSKTGCTTWPGPSSWASIRHHYWKHLKTCETQKIMAANGNGLPKVFLGHVEEPLAVIQLKLSFSYFAASNPQRRPCSSWSMSPKTADKFSNVKASQVYDFDKKLKASRKQIISNYTQRITAPIFCIQYHTEFCSKRNGHGSAVGDLYW